jgi:alpha-1,2-glucosyltransferase
VAIHKFTCVHPYLLADNRHYTFYVWRRLLSTPLAYPAIPMYLLGGWSCLSLLKTRDTLWKSLFVFCTFVSLVPQQLLEFRYFIVPYIIWRLNLVTTSMLTLTFELVLNVLINGLTIYLFLYKSFKWNTSSEVQRFMW